MTKEVTHTASELPVVYDSGISNLHQLSRTVHDCPVSVHGVQENEKIYEGEPVDDAACREQKPDVEAVKAAYNRSCYIDSGVNEFNYKYASANLYNRDQKRAELKYGGDLLEGEENVSDSLFGNRLLSTTC